MISKLVSRREFIKLASVAFVGSNVPGIEKFNDLLKPKPSPQLGRTIKSVRYYQEPNLSSKMLGYYITDSVVSIIDEEVAEAKPGQNPLWYRTVDGWLPSAYIQPVKNLSNKPDVDIPPNGMLVEVTVPFTQSWLVGTSTNKRAYRFYYGSTYWVQHAFQSHKGEVWYTILDDRLEKKYTVYAPHMRRITPNETTAISPGEKGKVIVVDLKRQKLTAYLKKRQVFQAQLASGYFDGETPQGEFRVERKQPSRHMAAGGDVGAFDLPGVPWVCYISWTGVSLHGTYWHNNYGNPMSHGCINLSPEDAKWVYRWTDPYVPLKKKNSFSDEGTRVIVL